MIVVFTSIVPIDENGEAKDGYLSLIYMPHSLEIEKMAGNGFVMDPTCKDHQFFFLNHRVS